MGCKRNSNYNEMLSLYNRPGFTFRASLSQSSVCRKSPVNGDINGLVMRSLIPAAFRPFRLALIQLATSADKRSNLHRARQLVNEACSNGANVVVLPVRSSLPPLLIAKGVF